MFKAEATINTALADVSCRLTLFKGRRRYSKTKHLKISVKLPENIRFRRCSPPILPSTDGCMEYEVIKRVIYFTKKPECKVKWDNNNW